MTREELHRLYNGVIMQHHRTPYHFGKRVDLPLVIRASNPVCGDRFTLFIGLENDRISEAWFHGFGCALSKGATSILMQRIEGMDLPAAVLEVHKFLNTRADGGGPEPADPVELLAMLREHEARRECIEMSWKSLQLALSELR